MSSKPVVTKTKVTQFKSNVRQRIQEKRSLQKQTAQQQQQMQRELTLKRKRIDGEDDSDEDESEYEEEDAEFAAALGVKKAKRPAVAAAADSDDDSGSDSEGDDEYDERQVRAALMAARGSLAAMTDDDLDALAAGEGSDEDEDEENARENTTVVVTNLPVGFNTARAIRGYFNQVSTVQRIEVDQDKNMAYLAFLTRETAELIVQELDYMLVDNKCLRLKLCDIEDPEEQEKKIWQPLLEKRSTQRHKNKLSYHLKDCTYFVLPGPQQLSDAGKLRERELNLERHYMRVNMVRNKDSIAEMINDVRERMTEDMKKWQALGINYDYAGLN